MRLAQRRLLAPALIVVLLAGSITTIYYGIINGPSAGPGVFLSLNLYDVKFENRMLVDRTSILDRPEVLMYLEVNAVTPPGFKWADDIVSVFKDTIKAKSEIYIKSEELQEIARGWVSTYESRRGNPERTYSGLIVRLFIINATSKEIMFEAYDSISYKPSEVAKGKAVKIDIRLLRGSHKPIKINVEHDYVRWYEELRAEPKGVTLNGGCYPFILIYRELVVEVKPEDLRSKLPGEYFNNFNGRLYVKTPILIAENVASPSGTMHLSINIDRRDAKTGVYPTFTSGKILEKITNGIAPSVTLWKGSGFTWGGSRYYFGYVVDVGPFESSWIWIWARPIYRVYKVYDGCLGYIWDDVENFITDVLTNGSDILGGTTRGLPHSELMNAFFKGTTMERLSIPGTSLADGKLDPNESITLGQIFQHFDKCKGDFEVGIPAGTIAALAICILLSIDGAACETAVLFASTFEISLSFEGSSIYIGGVLHNVGDHPRVPNDYNIYEIVYVAVSKYQYKVDPPWWCFWCSPCYYNVPAGIYFRFH